MPRGITPFERVLMLELNFEAELVEWRGPAPFFFAPIPSDCTGDIRAAAKLASYGWGVIPVTATIDGVAFTTSLFPKDGNYLLPLKVAVRKRHGITVGDRLSIGMSIVPLAV
ncbi:protein of unknown function [Pelagibacterium halotolerans]|nr:protein of unknown function [Pelagibacterium halotolerans]